MKTSLKRFLSLAMALFIVISLMPVRAVFAAETEDENAAGLTGVNGDAYTGQQTIWGQANVNASESMKLELYSGDALIATTELVQLTPVLTGEAVDVTWNFYLNEEAEAADGYWDTTWEDGYPNIYMQPDRVVLYLDGSKVDEDGVQLNAPDNLKKIVAWAEGYTGGVQAYTSLKDAIGNFNGRTVNVLCDVTESIEKMNGATLTTNVEGGVTITTSYASYVYSNDLNIGKGVTVNATKWFFETDSVNTVEGTLVVGSGESGTFYHGYDAKTTIRNGGKIIVNGSTILRYNEDADAGIYIYGDGDDETVEFSNSYYIGAYSGTFYAKDANIETGYFLLKNSYDSSDYADIDMTLDNSSLTVVGTSDTQDSFIIDDQASLTLVNGASIEDVRDFNILAGANLTFTVDETSSIGATYVNIADDVPFEYEKNEDGTVKIEPKTIEMDETNKVTTIYNAEGLKAFAAEVNSGNNFKGWTVKLAADIDLNGEEWTPIGNSTYKFSGTFDGQEHTISNLVITGNKSNVGLFGFTTEGEIKNLTIENANVSGYLNVGVVAGTPYTSKYTNITVTGHVEVNGYAYVGGVGGKNAYANWTDITVDVDSTSYVKASSENYRTYVGGVVGFNGEGSHTFKNISSNIKVIGSTGDIGGLFGIAHYGNNFENVTFTGSVEAPEGAYQVGGIAGVWHNEVGETVTFTNVVSTGTVTVGEETTTGSVVGAAYKASNETPSTSGSLIIDGEEAWLAVAKIGDTKYATLQAAIEAVAEGETIVLMDDVTVTEAAYGQNALNHARAVSFTLDLNGKTLSADTGNSVLRFNISGSGATSDVTVTIKNGKIVSGANTWCTVMASGIDGAKAVMNLEDLTIENSKGGDYAVKAWGNGVVNAENVTINASYGGGFYAVGGEVVLDNCTVTQTGMHTAPYMSMAVAVSTGGKMTVNSGSYSTVPAAASDGYNQGSSHGSWAAGIMSSGGTLIINGGTFANGNYGDDSLATAARALICVDAYGELIINGGEFNALGSAVYMINNTTDGTAANPTAEINGGNFVVGGDTLFTGYPTGLLYVYGGTFSAPVAEEFCVDGYLPTEISDGIYGVKIALEAMIGTRPYSTLALALAAAKDGDTIQLLGNVYAGDLVIEKNITIGAFSGVTLTAASIHVKGDKTLTLSNVKTPETKIYADSVEAGASINGTVITGIASQPATVVSDGTTATVTNPAWVAKIGNTYYMDLAVALNAAQEGDTVYLQPVIIDLGGDSVGLKLPTTMTNVTIKGAEGHTSVIKNGYLIQNQSNFNLTGVTFDGIVFEDSYIVLTPWDGNSFVKDFTINNCIFQNLDDANTMAPLHATQGGIQNLTFTNNVVKNLTGGNKSGVYAWVSGNTVISGNTFDGIQFRPVLLQVYNNDGTADKVTFTDNTISNCPVGRVQILGTGTGGGTAGTDAVSVEITNNSFTGITDSQQFCVYNLNAEKTDTDFSNNYYDIDVEANPGRFIFNDAASDVAALIEMGVYPYYADAEMTELVYAPKVTIGGTRYDTIDAALAAAKSGDTITLHADATLTQAYNVENMILTIEGIGKLTVNDASDSNLLKVYGETTLNISAPMSGEVWLGDGTILKDSTISGNVFVAGNVTFSGKNTVAMLYDFGTLVSSYGAEAEMKWTVEKGGSLTLTSKSRYGLGYGDNITIYGSLEDALNARETLTEDDLSLFMHGISMSSYNGYDKAYLTVKDAYVTIGSNSSFGTKTGNSGEFAVVFENSVLDASRITIYSTDAKSTFDFTDSDVKVGQFMTRDADSVFTLTNSVLLSTSTTNGPDEGNYHAGKLILAGSSLTYSAPLVMEGGVIEMDLGSLIAAPSITGTGTIIVDATGFNAANGVKVIDADMSAFEGTIVVKGAVYTADENGLIINPAAASIGEACYATLAEAVKAAQAGQTITLLANGDLILADKAMTIIKNGYTVVVAALNGYTVVETENAYIVKDASNVTGDAGEAKAYIDADGDGYIDEEMMTLQAALDAAQAGQTVCLVGDLVIDGSITIPSGVTLNLEGYTLTVNSLVGLSGSKLAGTPYDADGTCGKLVVDPENFVLPAASYVDAAGYNVIPVYNVDHYVFSRMQVDTNEAKNRGLVINEEANSIYFQFVTNMTGDVRRNLLIDGTGDNELQIIIRLEWQTESGTAHQDFVYNDVFVEKVCEGGNDFNFTLTGYDVLDIDLDTLVVKGMVITESGAVVSGTEWTK